MSIVIEAKGSGGIQVNLHKCRNRNSISDSLKSVTRPPENCCKMFRITSNNLSSIISDIKLVTYDICQANMYAGYLFDHLDRVKSAIFHRIQISPMGLRI